MCESNVHTWEKPKASARLARSTTRAEGGVVWRTTPKSTTWKSSSVLRKTEVDAACARVGPTRGHNFGLGVEVDAFRAVHVSVAEQAGLPTAEAVVADGHGDRHVDTDHPDLHVELELSCRTTVAGKDGGAVAVRVVVDQLQ